MSAQTWEVPENLGGQRLDKVLSHLAGISRKQARISIGEGRVQVNRRTLRIMARTVSTGARVALLPETSPAPSTERQALRILHLDQYLVAIDKPSGLLSESDRNEPNALSETLFALRGQGERKDALWLVHRLDAQTSGVMLLTRTPMATTTLSKVFADRRAQKSYLAWVAGTFPAQMSCDEPIGRVRGTQHGVTPDGKPATTDFRCLATGPDLSLIEARPRTGRTHQIRVHLKHLGFPIVGDPLYGGPRYLGKERKAVSRLMLHAETIEVPHPKTGETISVRAPIPELFALIASSEGVSLELSERSWHRSAP